MTRQHISSQRRGSSCKATKCDLCMWRKRVHDTNMKRPITWAVPVNSCVIAKILRSSQGWSSGMSQLTFVRQRKDVLQWKGGPHIAVAPAEHMVNSTGSRRPSSWHVTKKIRQMDSCRVTHWHVPRLGKLDPSAQR